MRAVCAGARRCRFFIGCVIRCQISEKQNRFQGLHTATGQYPDFRLRELLQIRGKLCRIVVSDKMHTGHDLTGQLLKCFAPSLIAVFQKQPAELVSKISGQQILFSSFAKPGIGLRAKCHGSQYLCAAKRSVIDMDRAGGQLSGKLLTKLQL